MNEPLNIGFLQAVRTSHPIKLGDVVDGRRVVATFYEKIAGQDVPSFRLGENVSTSRIELKVDPETEQKHIVSLAEMLTKANYNADNSTLVAVSSDYSSIVWQVLRHHLSFYGEVCGGLSIDVPYPDQEWTDETSSKIIKEIASSPTKSILIFVEAGVIRGSNYQKLSDLIGLYYPEKRLIFTTLYENVGSKFKSDFVAKYYDDAKEDLTFWWERFNNHWK